MSWWVWLLVIIGAWPLIAAGVVWLLSRLLRNAGPIDWPPRRRER